MKLYKGTLSPQQVMKQCTNSLTVQEMAELEKNTDDPHSKSVLGKKKRATFFLFNKHPKVETAPQGCKMAPRLENIFFFCSALKRCTRNPILVSFDIGRYCRYSGKKQSFNKQGEACSNSRQHGRKCTI